MFPFWRGMTITSSTYYCKTVKKVQIRYLPTFYLRANWSQSFALQLGEKFVCLTGALSLHHKKGMFKCYDRYLEIASRLCTDFAAKDKFDKSRTSRWGWKKIMYIVENFRCWRKLIKINTCLQCLPGKSLNVTVIVHTTHRFYKWVFVNKVKPSIQNVTWAKRNTNFLVNFTKAIKVNSVLQRANCG